MTFPKVNDIFPTIEKWNEWASFYGIDEMDSDIYSNILIRYGGDRFRYSSGEMAAAKMFQILSIEYPAYIQKKSAAQAVYDLELEEIKKGTLQIANSAANPNSDPETDSLDPLPFINGQQVMGTKLDELAALPRKYRAVYTKYLEELLKSLQGLFQGILAETEEVFLYD